jgi:four helix bundle protein
MGMKNTHSFREGKRRKRRRPLLNHLDIALGSQGEVEVQLEIARRVGFLPAGDYRRLISQIDEIGRMLNGLITSLQPTDEEENL